MTIRRLLLGAAGLAGIAVATPAMAIGLNRAQILDLWSSGQAYCLLETADLKRFRYCSAYEMMMVLYKDRPEGFVPAQFPFRLDEPTVWKRACPFSTVEQVLACAGIFKLRGAAEGRDKASPAGQDHARKLIALIRDQPTRAGIPVAEIFARELGQ